MEKNNWTAAKPFRMTEDWTESEAFKYMTFTFSNFNTIPVVEEVQRFKNIADYFAKKENRERYNPFNLKYLEEMHKRLLAIQGESLPEHVSGLCTKLLKRFDAGII